VAGGGGGVKREDKERMRGDGFSDIKKKRKRGTGKGRRQKKIGETDRRLRGKECKGKKIHHGDETNF